MDQIKWERNCPKCKIRIIYKGKKAQVAADKNNSVCLSCRLFGTGRHQPPFERVCPVCKKIIICSTAGNMKASIEKLCRECLVLSRKILFRDRNCPICKKVIMYKTRETLRIANKKNSPCRSCVFKSQRFRDVKHKFGKGSANPKFKGVMNETSWNRTCPNCGNIKTYKNYSSFRKAKYKNYGCGCITKNSWACFNPKACQIFDEINKEMNWNGQHALNGGEKKVLNYWVDYYEPTLNLVIEYDEKFHKYTTGLDKKRQEEIVTTLNCQFHRIPEGSSWRQIINA